MDITFAIRPIKWQLELDQGVTEFYVYTNFAIGTIDWIFEIRSSEQLTGKFRIRPGRH